MAPVIVFGPTGNIGAIAAQTAGSLGAEVYLAMRDPSKTIKDLDEKSGDFHRIQADLDKPDTVKEAVSKSGAKRAFFYASHGSKDHMKATIEAMKEGGIETPVFLSSFTVVGEGEELKKVPQSELIPYIHSMIEVSLQDVYGIGKFVAVRPGGFATNNLRYKDQVQKGEVRMFGGEFNADNITQGDMGRVSGTILVNGAKNGQNHVYLYGPQMKSVHDALKEIGSVLGKDLTITPVGKDEGYKQYVDTGVPPFFAEYMCRVLSSDDVNALKPTDYEEGVKNVELYTGKPSQDLKSWTEENRGQWES